jgi:hypothetical protein
MTSQLIVLVVFLGLIPAEIARRKGRSFVEFWVFGAAAFIIALPVALMIKPQPTASEVRCPSCAEIVKRAARVCKHCHRDLPDTVFAG